MEASCQCVEDSRSDSGFTGSSIVPDRGQPLGMESPSVLYIHLSAGKSIASMYFYHSTNSAEQDVEVKNQRKSD